MGKPSHTEVIAMFLLFAVFLTVNLLTATRFPIPWYDEVQFVDPAANLYLNGTFTTTAYRWERGTDLHANHPLYSFLLAGWFEMTGFGLVQARAFNYLLTILTASTIWLAVKRSGLIPSANYRLVLILLLLFGYSVSFPYRAGRIEPLLMLLSAVIFFAFTVENRRLRFGLLSVVTLLFAPAGLHLVVFAAVITFLAVLYLGRYILAEAVVIWCSLVVSVAGLFTFYATQGVLENALSSITPHTGTGGLGALFSGEPLNHVNRIPKDPSLTILLALLALVVIDQVRRARFCYRSALSFGIALSIIVPLALLSSAKFPTYYSWMVFVPLSICLCSTIAFMRPRRPAGLALGAGLVSACLAGLPLQLAAATYDWEDRNYSTVHEIVAAHVTRDDRVLSDYQAYFAAKATAAEVFLPDYTKLLTADEKIKLTLLIGPADSVMRWRSLIGGKWELAAEGIEPERPSILHRLTGRNIDVGLIGKKYRFTIHRRQT